MTREALDTYAVRPDADADVIALGETIFEQADVTLWALLPILQEVVREWRAVERTMARKQMSAGARLAVRVGTARWVLRHE